MGEKKKKPHDDFHPPPVVAPFSSNFIFVSKICSFISFPQSFQMEFSFLFFSHSSSSFFPHEVSWANFRMESTFRMKNTIHSYCYFFAEKTPSGGERKGFVCARKKNVQRWDSLKSSSQMLQAKIVTWTLDIYNERECIESGKFHLKSRQSYCFRLSL